MGNDTLTQILVNFGVGLDEKQFKEAVEKLKMYMKKAAEALKMNDSMGSNTFIDAFMSNIETFEKKIGKSLGLSKKQMQDFARETSKAFNIDKHIDGYVKNMERVRKAEKSLPTPKKETNSDPAKGTSSGKAKSAQIFDLEAEKKKIAEVYGIIDKNSTKFARSAYSGTIGKLPANASEGLFKTVAADFKKYFEADVKFGKATGNADWANRTSFNKVFEGVTERVLRFDKDIGFFSTRLADGAKALGVSQDTIRKTQQLTVDGLDALKKVLDIDKKSGNGKGLFAINELKGFYGQGAAGADVFGGPLLQSMKLMNNPAYQKMGLGGNAASLANAAVQGNIELSSKSLKINNELGLAAVKINEDQAIKLGLLSKQYGGTAYQVQELNKKYQKLSPEQKKIYEGFKVDEKSPESIKRALAAFSGADKEASRLKALGQTVDYNTLANEKYVKSLEAAARKKNAFDLAMEKATDPSQKAALTAASARYGGDDSARMQKMLPAYARVETAIQQQAAAMGLSEAKARAFSATFDRVALAEDLVSGKIKIVNNEFKAQSATLTETEKALKKVQEIDPVRGKQAIAEMSAKYQDASVYAKDLLKTTEAMQKGNFQKTGITASPAVITSAKMAGDIDLTTKSLKIHNDAGLQALGITKEFAIAQGLISTKFVGNAYNIQKLTTEYKRLTAEERLAFKATGAKMDDYSSFKTGLKAVKDASNEAIKVGVAGNFDLAATAAKNYTDAVTKAQVSTKSAFDTAYSKATTKGKFALDSAAVDLGGTDSPGMDAYIKKYNQVEEAIKMASAAKREDANASKSFYQTANREVLVQDLLDKKIQIVNGQLRIKKTLMTETERVLFKYKNQTDAFKQALSDMMRMYGSHGDPFNRHLAYLKEAAKRIDETKEKLMALGKTQAEANAWGDQFNLTDIGKSGLKVGEGERLTREVDKVDKSFDKLHNTGGILRRGLTDLFEKFKILAGYAISGSIVYGLGNMFKQAIVNVVQYDQALKDLQAITQSTNEETKQMGEEIFRVATTTKFSAMELAEGMKLLGQAGFSASQSIKALEPIAQLATATLSDFATINDLVTTTMGAFDLDDDNIVRVTDVFGAAINRSKLDVEKLRVAMNYVGPVAHDAGLSIEEVSAAMGLFANSGLRASTIGTAFRQIISQLLTPSEEFKQAILLAGYSLDEVNPRTNEFSKIIEKLVHIVPDAENAFKFFGQRGASAISVLTKTGTEGFEKMTDSMRVGGTVAEMAAKQMEGLGVITKNLTDTFGVMGIKMGQAFGVDTIIELGSKALKGMLTSFMEVTGGIGVMIASFIQLGAVITGSIFLWKSLTTAIATVSGAQVTQLTLSMQILRTAFTSFTASITATAFSIGALAVPVWAVIAGITALVVGIGTFLAANRPWESALEKNSRALQKQEQEISANIKANNLLVSSAEGLQKVVEDSEQSLEDRVLALKLLKNAGAEVDDGINDNISSVEYFDIVLGRSKGNIEAYITKLKDLGVQYGVALGKLVHFQIEQAKAQKTEAIGNIVAGEKVVLDFNGMPIITKELDEEGIAEEVEAVNNAESTLKNKYDMIVGGLEKIIKNNFAIESKLKEAQVNFDEAGINEALQDAMDKLNQNEAGIGAIPLEDQKAAITEFAKNLKSFSQHVVAEQEHTVDSLIKINESGNRSKQRLAATKNIETLGVQYGDIISKQAEEEKRLADKFGESSIIYRDAVARHTKSREENFDFKAKEVEKNIKIIQDTDNLDIEIIEAEEKARLSGLKELNASGKVSDEQYEKERERIRVEIASRKYDAAVKVYDLAVKSGIVTEKTLTELEKQKHLYMSEVKDASADMAVGLKKAGEKADKERERDLREQLKALHDIYKVELSKLKEAEEVELQKNAVANALNVEAKEEEEYNIKVRWGNERLKLIQDLIAKERAIKDAGGSITADKMGQIELAKWGKDDAGLHGDKNVRDQQKDQEDSDERIALIQAERERELSLNMDWHEQQVGLENLYHQQAMSDLENKLARGQILESNYQIAKETQIKAHNQRIVDIERQTASMRLANQAQLVGELGGIMGELYAASGEKMIAFFYAQKALVVTEMIMNAYKTWSDAMASPNVNPMFNIPMASLVFGMSMAKAGIVAGLSVAQGVKGFAEGGEIGGYSPNPTADNVPIMATAGEFMQPVPTVQYYGKGVMEALRTRSIPREALSPFSKSSSKSGGRHFAEGGGVESQPEGGKDKGESLSIVNILDPGMFDQYVSSNAGQKAIMNVISRNPAIIKGALR